MQRWLAGLAFWVVMLAGLSRPAPGQNLVEGLPLDRLGRIYGLTVVQSEKMELLAATGEGLYRTRPEGRAVAQAGLQGHLMGFSALGGGGALLAGGHPGGKGSIGLLRSEDGGRVWTQVAPRGAGDEGFHLLAASGAKAGTVYGLAAGLRVSNDGGRAWQDTGSLPEGLIHLAASARKVDTLYAATRGGLLISHDRGGTWQPVAHPPGIAAMVHVSPPGRVFLFVVGQGLLAADEEALRWQTLSRDFQDQVLVRMTDDHANPARLYGVTLTNAIVTSGDGGKSWGAYEGAHLARPESIARGKQLFQTYCQVCHGADGRGQQTTPGFDPKNPPAIAAPALDNSAHAWHHSDENLRTTILEGSPREGSPMVAWKHQLSPADADALVAYIKSLWNFRSAACQGARHMACMRQ